MPEPMTKEQLEEICKRAEAATAGPWEGHEFAHAKRVYRVEIVSPILQYGKRVASRLIAQMIDYCEWTDHPANLAFILNARTDIPALLAEVERLTAELEEWKAGSGEESSRLNWLINKMNNAADVEDLVEDLFDNLPGDSEDIQMEVRAAIDAKRKRRP